MPLRTIEQLKESSDTLSGIESQTLRTLCHSEYLNVQTGLSDPVGRLLKDNDLEGLKKHITASTDAHLKLGSQKWGPTRVPAFNVLLILLYLHPERRDPRMQMVRYLASEAMVPVDGTDLAGNSALMYSISTKPYLDLEFADVMLSAGADVNKRNRYGCTAASDIVMVWPGSGTEDAAAKGLKWFVDHGGNPDIMDGDGLMARSMVKKSARFNPKLAQVLAPASGQSGQSTASAASAASGKKVGRNEPCMCGSKKKYKTCCGKP